MIEIKAVDNKKLLGKFIDFPHDLYEGDKNYVPELFIAQRDLLSPGKHPFYEHSEVQLFLAYNNGKIVGRIAAILNNNHNKFNNSKDGFFGFFEAENDQAVVNALFTAAEQWLKNKGVENVVGPVSPSTNDICGLMIDGFDRPPMVMTPYNKTYYSSLISNEGYDKKVDLLAYYLQTTTVSDRALKLQEVLMNRLRQRNIIIRPLSMKNFADEVVRIRQVYNEAWDKNLGFVPMTDNEFKYLAKDLKMIVDPNACFVAEENGKIIGFALALPDVNQIQIKIKKGRLLPTGIFKLLFGLKKIDNYRILALGVIEGYKKMGIEACFYASIINRAKAKNIKGGEASWILENNELMNKGIQNLNGEVYKRYRLYEKAI